MAQRRDKPKSKNKKASEVAAWRDARLKTRALTAKRKEKAAARTRVLLDGSAPHHPIVIEDDFRIKIEDPDIKTEQEEEEGSSMRSAIPIDHIPALREPGKPRGFASWVSRNCLSSLLRSL